VFCLIQSDVYSDSVRQSENNPAYSSNTLDFLRYKIYCIILVPTLACSQLCLLRFRDKYSHPRLPPQAHYCPFSIKLTSQTTFGAHLASNSPLKLRSGHMSVRALIVSMDVGLTNREKNEHYLHKFKWPALT
jgi:hypothetical protein